MSVARHNLDILTYLIILICIIVLFTKERPRGYVGHRYDTAVDHYPYVEQKKMCTPTTFFSLAYGGRNSEVLQINYSYPPSPKQT